MEKKKPLLKRKAFWIPLGVALTLAMGGGCIMSMRNAMQRAQDLLQNQIKEVTVERSTVSQVVSGSGNLQVARTVNTTAPSGVKVLSVPVRLGDRVSQGDVLATLDADSILAQLADAQDALDSSKKALESGDLSGYRKEICQHQIDTLQAKISSLEALRANPVIVAPCDGIIEKLALEEGASIGSTSLASLGTTTLDTEGLGFSLPSLAARILPEPENPQEDPPAEPVPITAVESLVIEDPAQSGSFQSEIPETDQYTGTISWNLTDTAFLATVVLQAKEGYTVTGFTADGLTGIPEETRAKDGFAMQVAEDGSALALAVPFDLPDSGGEEIPVPDIPVIPDEIANLDLSKILSDALSKALPSADAGMDLSPLYGASLTEDYLSGISGQSLTGSLSSVYSGTDAVVCVIDTLEEALITVQIDEQDILLVEEGQQADVTLDALQYQTFHGTISRVAATASSTGGSTKYPVEIRIRMQEDMRFGMSASAEIKVGETQDALTIPMAALQQTGEQTFVYTALTKEQELTGETPVETGLADGNIVEILSGLSEGDTVYYMELDANPFAALLGTEE